MRKTKFWSEKMKRRARWGKEEKWEKDKRKTKDRNDKDKSSEMEMEGKRSEMKEKRRGWREIGDGDGGKEK